MKILINQKTYSEKFVSITNALYTIKNLTIGHANGQLDEESLISFAPDLVIHNDQDSIDKFRKYKFIQLYLFENNPNDQVPSFNIGTIGPVVDITILNNIKKHERFKSDIVLFSNPSLFDNEILFYSSLNFSLKIFSDRPIRMPQYCGTVRRDEHSSYYLGAKASPWSFREDMSRLYEIVASDGKPVIYNGDASNFHNDINKRMSGIDIFYDIPDKKTILDKFSNRTCLNKILRSNKLNKLANLMGV